jgi:hypothetical protein
MSGSTTSPAGLSAYGGYAATPGNEAQLMAMRRFPYRFAMQPQTGVSVDGAAATGNGQSGGLLGQAMPQAAMMPATATAPAASADAASLPAYDDGGVISPMPSTGTPAYSSVIQQLINLGVLAPGSTQGAGGTVNGQDATSRGADPASNFSGTGGYGPTNSGFAGLAPSGSSELARVGGMAATMAAGAPVGGLVGALGNGFNGAVAGAQQNDIIGQITGTDPQSPAMAGVTGAMGELPGTVGGMTGAVGAALAGLASSQNNDPNAVATGLMGNYAGYAPGLTATQAAQNYMASRNINDPSVSNPGPDGQYVGAFGPANGMPIGPPGNPGMGDDGGQGYAGPGTAGADASAAGSSDAGRGADTNMAAGGRVGLYAAGGAVEGVVKPYSSNRFLHMLSRGSGLVHGSSPGRADALVAKVPKGGYVVPADVVSSIGQGNTLAGAKRLTSSIGGLPKYPFGFARGGAVDHDHATIRISSGEYFVHPRHVAAMGGGDLRTGQARLDQLVAGVRQAAAHRALSAPPPR